MTRAEVDEVAQGAPFETDHSGRCTIRFYRGWNRDNFYVGVAFTARHRVVDKDSWAQDEGWFLGC